MDVNKTDILRLSRRIDDRVITPDSNSDEYFPQWDGENSKTLKNGYSLDELRTALFPTETFSCTAESGCTINSQNCVYRNGFVIISLHITKNSGTFNSNGYYNVAQVPSDYVISNSGNAVGSVEGYYGGEPKAIGTARVYGTDYSNRIMLLTNYSAYAVNNINLNVIYYKG